LPEEAAMSSDKECREEVDGQDLQQKDEERDLKDQLLCRFGSHISDLRLEFSKKKKKGKLPKEATQTLFEWWRDHYKWPYPTVSTWPSHVWFSYNSNWIIYCQSAFIGLIELWGLWPFL